jgi:hypothetical protein
MKNRFEDKDINPNRGVDKSPLVKRVEDLNVGDYIQSPALIKPKEVVAISSGPNGTTITLRRTDGLVSKQDEEMSKESFEVGNFIKVNPVGVESLPTKDMVDVEALEAAERLEIKTFSVKFLKERILPLLHKQVSEVKSLQIIGNGNEIILHTAFKALGGNIQVKAVLENNNGSIVVKNHEVDAIWPYKGQTEKKIVPHLNEVSDMLKTYIEKEVGKVVKKIEIENGQLKVTFEKEQSFAGENTPVSAEVGSEMLDDPRYGEALAVVLATGQASASYLQRRLKLGYSRAARIIEILEENGIISHSNGSHPREILWTPEQIEQFLDNQEYHEEPPTEPEQNFEPEYVPETQEEKEKREEDEKRRTQIIKEINDRIRANMAKSQPATSIDDKDKKIAEIKARIEANRNKTKK